MPGSDAAPFSGAPVFLSIHMDVLADSPGNYKWRSILGITR